VKDGVVIVVPVIAELIKNHSILIHFEMSLRICFENVKYLLVSIVV